MKPPRRKKWGSALVITLALIILIVVLVLGFLTTARLDATSSRTHLHGVEAAFYAEAGANVALAELRTALTDTNRAWISQPGRLIVSPPGTNQPMTSVVDLSSGSTTLTASGDEAADLNPTTLQNASRNLLAPTNVGLRVRWVYVRKDGTLDTSTPPPAYNSNNPVVGRFAFWVDDESTKVNINTAWARATANTNGPMHPSKINLAALPGLDATEANAIRGFRTNSHFFNSIRELRQVDTNTATLAETNQLLMTHYSHVPDLNMFGVPRIVLTTQKRLAQADASTTNAEFLDITKQDNIDPGSYDNLDPLKVTQAIRKIFNYLDNTNWPFYPGHSFSDKYTQVANDKSQAFQIAANILEYVRCAESTNAIVDPIRGANVKASNLSNPNWQYLQLTGDYQIGLTRRPYITEMGMWVAQNFNTNGTTQEKRFYPFQFAMEMYLPPGGVPVDLTTLVLTVQWWNGANQTVGSTPVKNAPILPLPKLDPPDTTNCYLDSTDKYLQPGGYRTLTIYGRALAVNVGFVNGVRPSVITLRPGLGRLIGTTGISIDATPVSATSDNTINYTVDAPNGNTPTLPATSMMTVDPLVNARGGDWAQGSSTFGQRNLLRTVTFAGPQQDSDAAGNVVTNSTQFPAPKGTAGNPSGVVQSLGELGYVHTGNSGFPTPGIPWRTLRLQPQKAGATTIPDWAILDLFSLPFFPNEPGGNLLRPNNRNLGGAINLNGKIPSFTDGSGNALLTREAATKALLLGASKDGSTALTAPEVENLVTAITNQIPASRIGNQGQAYSSGPMAGLLYTPAQVAEFSGVTDGGEASEALLRDVVNVASARGNVFSIQSIGQTISQSPGGAITVLGERRMERTVERWFDGRTAVFRPVSARDIAP